MKIALLIDSLGSGGAQRQIVNLAEYLVSEGNEVTIIHYYEANHYKNAMNDYGLESICIKKSHKYDFLFIFKILYLLKNQKINVIVSYLFVPNFIAIILKVLSFGKLKIIISERSFEKNTPVIFRKLRFFYFIADIISVNSISQRDFLKSKLRKLADRIHFTPNGLDEKAFLLNSGKERLAFDKAIGVLGVGRIESNKNPILLIYAAYKLRQMYGVNLSITWLGAQNEANLSYKENCDKLIAQYKLQWTWLPPSNQIKNYYASTNVLYHGSYGEGFPNVVCEGMAAGCLIIASQVYDHPYIISDSVNGFLFDPAEVDSLVNAFERVRNSSGKQRCMISENAVNTAKVHFTKKSAYRIVLNLINNLTFVKQNK